MVTMNSGTAMPMSAGSVKAGTMNTGWGTRLAIVPGGRGVATTIMTAVTATAIGIANGRAKRSAIAQAAMIGSVRPGRAATAFTGARHSSSSTPASIAPASDNGIEATARPKGRQTPAATISTPATRNAPTATG